jgi:hypothetical protein
MFAGQQEQAVINMTGPCLLLRDLHTHSIDGTANIMCKKGKRPTFATVLVLSLQGRWSEGDGSHIEIFPWKCVCDSFSAEQNPGTYRAEE